MSYNSSRPQPSGSIRGYIGNRVTQTGQSEIVFVFSYSNSIHYCVEIPGDQQFSEILKPTHMAPTTIAHGEHMFVRSGKNLLTSISMTLCIYVLLLHDWMRKFLLKWPVSIYQVNYAFI